MSWCRYCKGSYPKYWCEVTNEYVPWGIVERSCKNNGYKCSYYYISTVTGVVLKKDKNDEVLNSIRNLRDNYLENSEEHRELLDIYDIIGPCIADRIDKDPEREFTARRVYSILSRISKLINKEEYERATNYYSRMVSALASKYGILVYCEKTKENLKTKATIRKVQKLEKTLD